MGACYSHEGGRQGIQSHFHPCFSLFSSLLPSLLSSSFLPFFLSFPLSPFLSSSFPPFFFLKNSTNQPEMYFFQHVLWTQPSHIFSNQFNFKRLGIVSKHLVHCTLVLGFRCPSHSLRVPVILIPSAIFPLQPPSSQLNSVLYHAHDCEVSLKIAYTVRPGKLATWDFIYSNKKLPLLWE